MVEEERDERRMVIPLENELATRMGMHKESQEEELQLQ